MAITMEDRQIIDLYLARDEQAIAETDKKYGAFCTALSMNLLHDRQDAEECVNDTWRTAWNRIPPDIPQRLRTYLGHIVRAISIDRFRYNHAARRNRDMETALDELEGCIAAPDAADEAAGVQLRADVNEFLSSLPQADRTLFILRYYHMKPVKDIAAGLGMTPNAVSKRLMAARERMRAFLNERGYRL